MNILVIESEQKATMVNESADYYTSALNIQSSKSFNFDSIFSFQGRERKFILKYPIPCYFYYEDDSLIGECPSLGLISAGESEQEIRNNFDMEFEFLYENYFKEKDKNLTKDAKELKKALGSLLKNVEK